MNHYVCIHAHFYQPPRENPWLEEIELEDSAYPYHDWNERITAECYAPNAASRILDNERRIIDIENNYSKISFNFGPTLLSWMEKKTPEVYQAIIEADRLSRKQFSGHGSAIAQAYNHIIMPLANSRDKRTQVIWGLEDFNYRFGRDPEGMWLSETAVDLETLEILSEHGILFTILAPHQARRVRKIGEKDWKDVSDGTINPKRCYQCMLPSGRTIALFFYDGPVSREVAFGDLLKSGENFAGRLLGLYSKSEEPQLAHIATDGESYGHHHRFGDMALAYALHNIESGTLARLTNYGEYFEKYPPAYEVEIFENTSWSCAHGVERWRSNCGCNTGAHPGWTQEWRAPLREAMNWLRDNLANLYEREVATFTNETWKIRDSYISLIHNRSSKNIASFLSHNLIRELSKKEKVRLLKLLEMQRHSLLMFTSCGWFFDDISTIEALLVMKHASRAMQLAKEVAIEDLEPQYLEILKGAISNAVELKDGARVWEAFVRPAAADLLSAGAHYAISSLFEEYPETIKIGCYTTKVQAYDLMEAGIQRLAIGKARVSSDITGEEREVCFAVLHMGDHNLIGGVHDYMGDKLFSLMHEEIRDAFRISDIPEIIRLMDKHFETHNYSLWHLFRDEQRKVLNKILGSTMNEIETSFHQIYQRHYPVMKVMQEMHIPLPKAFITTTEILLNTTISRELQAKELETDEIKRLIKESKQWGIVLDIKNLSFVGSEKLTSLMELLVEAPEDTFLLQMIVDLLSALGGIPLELDLSKAQNIYFSIGTRRYDEMERRSGNGDRRAKQWLGHFCRLGEYLNVSFR